MINRTKLSVIAVSAVLAVALTGCGGSASSAPSSVSSAATSAPASSTAAPAADTSENGTADLDSAVETLLAANPISNQFEIAAMNIEYDFGLKAEDVAAYKGVKSNDHTVALGGDDGVFHVALCLCKLGVVAVESHLILLLALQRGHHVLCLAGSGFHHQHKAGVAVVIALHAGAVLSCPRKTQEHRAVFMQSGVLLLGRSALFPGT